MPAGLPVPPDALVGRAAELGHLTRLLTAPDTRLVTLTGPPGVGKTRLATAAATAVAERFRDGAVFVDLTAVRDAALVPAELAGALGAAHSGAGPGTAEHLAAAVADRDLLIVLDNFEHVLTAATGVAVALDRCPGLRVLVTSRERLHLRAEREIPVLPLAVPLLGDEVDLDRVAATPSVELLVQRVRAFDPQFGVTAANHAALAEICVRLDGLPLALELAAARLRLFSPGELTFRIRHRVAMLTSDALDVPDRHRTLHAALAWSHELLSPDERALFRRLSVFVGGATIEAAQHVCAVPDAVRLLASLVDKSLVQRRVGSGDVARLVMLQSLREFAADALDRAGETDATRARHGRWFAGWAAGIEARIGTGEERAAVGEVGLDVGDLHAALAHAVATRCIDRVLPLASALGWYAYTRGQLGSGQATLDAALAAAAGSPPPPDDALAGALLMAGVVAMARGQLDRAEEHVLAGLEVNERVGAPRRTAVGSAFLGHLARARGRPRDAVAHYERAGALHAELDNAPGVAWSRYDLGLLARWNGDTDRAAALLAESLERFRDLDYPWAVGCCAWALSSVELRRRRPDAAAALLSEALVHVDATDDDRGLASCLESTAALACDRARHTAAARLLGAAAALRDRLAAPLPAEEEGPHRCVADRLSRELGPAAADRARSAGRRMPRDDVLALARRVLVPPPTTAPAPIRPSTPLTPREREVALLVRQGRTNRQIARGLGISEKTAEVHVHHLIAKLRASSRAEVAAWVAVQEHDGVP